MPDSITAQDIEIEIVGDFKESEKKILRALILSRHASMRETAALFYRNRSIPPKAEETILEHTAEFAQHLFPGTVVRRNPKIDDYPGTILSFLLPDTE
jgi:hypothetical protein